MKKLKKFFLLILSFAVCQSAALGNVYAVTIDDEAGLYAQGPKDVEFYSITEFTDGGKDYVYFIDGVEHHYYQPPENFNPLIATDEELERYGFCPRPDVSQTDDYQSWCAVMSTYESTPDPLISFSRRQNSDEDFERTQMACFLNENRILSANAYNWSGYVAELDETEDLLFTQVQMDYTQPEITAIESGATNMTAYWIGIGGFQTGKLVQAGTVTIGDDNNKAWFEYLSPLENSDYHVSMQYESLEISAGDDIHVYIAFQRATGLFGYYIANLTTGEHVSGSVQCSTNDNYDGLHAEWIVERCCDFLTGELFSLGDYGQITLTNCKATYNTSYDWYDLFDFNKLYRINMINDERLVISSTSLISESSPETFVCTWQGHS